jgi:exonuclease SbcD
VGGAAQVGVDALEDFPYVALGHLHAPQGVAGRAHVRYSGSLLKYAFSEAQQHKGVGLVEVVGGRARVREVPLSPRRDVVRLEGSFEELLRHPRFSFAEGAYVEATYTDTGYLIDVARRLRERFPHLLLALPRHLALEAQAAGLPPEALRLEDTQALLADFWAYVSPEAPLGEEHRVAFQRLLDGLVKDGALERAA